MRSSNIKDPLLSVGQNLDPGFSSWIKVLIVGSRIVK